MSTQDITISSLVKRLSDACSEADISPPTVTVTTGRNRKSVIQSLMDAPNSEHATKPLRKDDLNRVAAAVRLANVPTIVAYYRSGKDYSFLYGRDTFAAYCRADKQDLIILCRYQGSDNALKLAAAAQTVATNPNNFSTLAALVSSFGDDWVGQFSTALGLNKADINRAAEIWADGGLHQIVDNNPHYLNIAHFLLSSNSAAEVLSNMHAGSISPQQAISQTSAIMAKASAEAAAKRAQTVGISVAENHQAALYLADLVEKEHNSNSAAARRLEMTKDACSFISNNLPEGVDPSILEPIHALAS